MFGCTCSCISSVFKRVWLIKWMRLNPLGTQLLISSTSSSGLLQAHPCLHTHEEAGAEGLFCSSHGPLHLPDRPQERGIQAAGLSPATPRIQLGFWWHHCVCLLCSDGRYFQRCYTFVFNLFNLNVVTSHWENIFILCSLQMSKCLYVTKRRMVTSLCHCDPIILCKTKLTASCTPC